MRSSGAISGSSETRRSGPSTTARSSVIQWAVSRPMVSRSKTSVLYSHTPKIPCPVSTIHADRSSLAVSWVVSSMRMASPSSPESPRGVFCRTSITW